MEHNPQTELTRKVLPRTFSVTSNASSVAKIPSNAHRVALWIGNTSAAIIFVNFTDEPAASQGIPLEANSGQILLTALQVGNALTGEIWLRMGAASVATFITEFIEAP